MKPSGSGRGFEEPGTGYSNHLGPCAAEAQPSGGTLRLAVGGILMSLSSIQDLRHERVVVA